MPGKSYPPPNHCVRSGMSQSERTNSHDAPRSGDRNRPPGMVPHHSSSGRSAGPFSSVHINWTVHGHGSWVIGDTSVASSGRVRIGRRADLGPRAARRRNATRANRSGPCRARRTWRHRGPPRRTPPVRPGSRRGRSPMRRLALEREQSLAGTHQQLHRHPPDSACITVISPSSVRRDRSAWPGRGVARHPTNTATWRRTQPCSSSTYVRTCGCDLEVRGEALGHGAPGDLGRRAVDMAAKVRCERDRRHEADCTRLRLRAIPASRRPRGTCRG